MTALLVSLSLWTAAPSAGCRESYEAVRYNDAVAACRAAIATAPRTELAELYRILGLSLAAQGEHAQAQRAFVSLLALDPAATLSHDYAPRMRADFEEAQHQGGGAPVSVKMTAPSEAFTDRPLDVGLEVEDGAGRPITQLSVKSGTDLRLLPRDAAPHVSLSPSPAPETRTVLAEGLDAFGGHLASASIRFDVQRPPTRSWLLSWKVWGVAAVVPAAAGVALGAFARSDGNASKGAQFASDAASLQTRANREAIGADVSFGVAVALAAWAVGLWLTQPGDAR